MQSFIKVRFLWLLVVIRHCRSRIDYKVPKPLLDAVFGYLRTSTNYRESFVFCYQHEHDDGGIKLHMYNQNFGAFMQLHNACIYFEPNDNSSWIKQVCECFYKITKLMYWKQSFTIVRGEDIGDGTRVMAWECWQSPFHGFLFVEFWS